VLSQPSLCNYCILAFAYAQCVDGTPSTLIYPLSTLVYPPYTLVYPPPPVCIRVARLAIACASRVKIVACRSRTLRVPFARVVVRFFTR
jgi:hypothetical protein